ncbi:MAG: galactose-1-phosphate uridylyltransferase [Candidatus Woesearchaeota archaeon]
MGEMRKDYILDRWVIIATERGKRPHEFRQENTKQPVKKCFFCPGNEDETPPEIMRVPKGKKRGKKDWKIRVFPNKFAAVSEEGSPEMHTENEFFTSSSNYGRHEVIVETPDHRKQLWDLPPKDLAEVLKVYSLRIKELHKSEGIRYVQVFKNSGKEAGTSLVHSHSQVIAYNNIPSVVEDEAEASRTYKERMGVCPYCCMINIEKDSERLCFENRSFIAIAPYAPRFPFEVWVLPKQHIKSITSMRETKLNDLAGMMKRVLSRLRKLNAPFNYVLHESPAGEDLHFHIEVLPRLSTWAGFEFNGTIINTMPPEEAAKFYREGSMGK